MRTSTETSLRRLCLPKESVWPVVFVIAVLFPSIWFVDFAFAFIGGRPVKMVAWVVVMGGAVAVAGYSAWLKRPARRAMLVAMILSYFSVCYFVIYQWMSPPVYSYNQAISLCILAPFSLCLGLSLRNGSAAPILGLLGCSVLLLFVFAVIKGTASLDSKAFQTFLPAKASGEVENTGYQGLSLFAGFLSVFILTRWVDGRGGKIVCPLCFFMISILPVFYIGGRSALVALLATSIVWMLLNGLRGKRQCFVVILLTSAALALGMIGYHYLERAPLGIQRLMWLAKAGAADSSGRLTLWSSAIDLWLQSPKTIILGHGPQQFPQLAGYDEVGMYPHNFILELLSEYGLVGCLLFFSAPVYLFADGILRRGLGFRKSPSFYFVVYYFSAQMFMGALQSIWPFFFFVGWLWFDLAMKEKFCASNSLVAASAR